MASHFDPVPRQPCRDLATAEEQLLREQLVDRLRQGQFIGARWQWSVAERSG